LRPALALGPCRNHPKYQFAAFAADIRQTLLPRIGSGYRLTT